MDEIGGNPSRCDGCPVFEHCEKICEDCEDKRLERCINGCPKDCGTLDQGPDPDEEDGGGFDNGDEDLTPEDDEDEDE